MQEARPVAAHEVGVWTSKNGADREAGQWRRPEARARPTSPIVRAQLSAHRKNGGEVMLAGGVELL